MKKEYRIYFNGRFQFSVSSTESQRDVAQLAANTLRINMKSAEFSPGVINLRTN